MPRPPVDLADYMWRLRVILRSVEGCCVAHPSWLDETARMALDVDEELRARRATDTQRGTERQRKALAIHQAHTAAVKAGMPRQDVITGLQLRFRISRPTLYRYLRLSSQLRETDRLYASASEVDQE